MKQHWLKDWPWATVVAINAGLCQEKNALHKPTSNGYEPAKKFGEKRADKNSPYGKRSTSAASATNSRRSVSTMATPSQRLVGY